MNPSGQDRAFFNYHFAPRYLEVDRQGVVFNMWYLGFFDDALAAFLADRGLPYPELLADGYDVALVRTEIDWQDGLRYGQDASVEVRVEHIGTTSFTLTFGVVRQGRRLSHGRTVYVVVAADGTGKRAIPQTLLRCLESGLSDLSD